MKNRYNSIEQCMDDVNSMDDMYNDSVDIMDDKPTAYNKQRWAKAFERFNFKHYAPKGQTFEEFEKPCMKEDYRQ